MLYKNSNFLLASLLVSINRGIVLKKKTISHKSSNFLIQIIKQFQKLGLISGFYQKNNLLFIYLKYDIFGNCVIKKLELMSKPGSKLYKNLFNIEKICSHNPSNLYLLSTSLGVLNNIQALKLNIGGELLCKINL